MLKMDVSQRQVQIQKLSQRQIQAIKLLQSTRMELLQYITQELEQNPALELVEEELVVEEDTPEEEPEEVLPPKTEYDKEVQELEKKTEELDIDWKNYYEDMGYYEDEERKSFENWTKSQNTLYEHLLEQLRIAAYDKKEFRIGEYLLTFLTADGFIPREAVEIVSKALNVDKEFVEGVLDKICLLYTSPSPRD